MTRLSTFAPAVSGATRKMRVAPRKHAYCAASPLLCPHPISPRPHALIDQSCDQDSPLRAINAAWVHTRSTIAQCLIKSQLTGVVSLFSGAPQKASELKLSAAGERMRAALADIVCGGCKEKWAAKKAAARWALGTSFEREQVKDRSELSCLIYAKTSLQ